MTDDGKDSAAKSSESTSEESINSPEDPTNGKSSSSQDGQGSGVIEEVVTPTIEWQHPLLKGKSPEEVERIFAVQQRSLTEVTSEANRYHKQLQERPEPSAPAPAKEEEEPYGSDFLAPRFQALESRLMRAMDNTVKPLREEFGRERGLSTREKFRQNLKHFTALEPYIDQIMREQGQDPEAATEGYLKMVYHTALGVATAEGIDLGEPAAPAPTGGGAPPPKGEEAPVTIPQHRPSAAPLPTGGAPKKVRELTESEKILAKEFFPNEEHPEDKYREMQDLDEFKVVEPGFSKEGW